MKFYNQNTHTTIKNFNNPFNAHIQFLYPLETLDIFHTFSGGIEKEDWQKMVKSQLEGFITFSRN